MKKIETIRGRIELLIKGSFKNKSDFASKLKCSPSLVSDWVLGKKYPSLDMLKRIHEITKISLDWIILGKVVQDLNEHEFAKIVASTHDWAKVNKIESNDSFLVSMYLTFKEERKHNISLTIEEFLNKRKEFLKNIKFFSSDEPDDD